jgi:hypothetical protein
MAIIIIIITKLIQTFLVEILLLNNTSMYKTKTNRVKLLLRVENVIPAPLLVLCHLW